jgi:4-hydroxyacetophenone monooxygenase
MNLFAGYCIKQNDIKPGYEELAFDEFPRGVNWTCPNAPPQDRVGYEVLVIGAGLSGIATAIQLKRLGIPYKVIERQSGVGGTWLWNDYPEACVDTLSYLFQYKFEKKYQWNDSRVERFQHSGYCSTHNTILGMRETETGQKIDQFHSMWTF